MTTWGYQCSLQTFLRRPKQTKEPYPEGTRRHTDVGSLSLEGRVTDRPNCQDVFLVTSLHRHFEDVVVTSTNIVHPTSENRQRNHVTPTS